MQYAFLSSIFKLISMLEVSTYFLYEYSGMTELVEHAEQLHRLYIREMSHLGLLFYYVRKCVKKCHYREMGYQFISVLKKT